MLVLRQLFQLILCHGGCRMNFAVLVTHEVQACDRQCHWFRSETKKATNIGGLSYTMEMGRISNVVVVVAIHPTAKYAVIKIRVIQTAIQIKTGLRE